ncbi:hypothetical protein BSK54_06520 [Paenibacillus odorifer]|nr:hypothetical protein BSK64_20005 [Paenibacillus odorifer]OME03745.1 hypothetical protein BSK54_06520 [Paenibacillus odorifer]
MEEANEVSGFADGGNERRLGGDDGAKKRASSSHFRLLGHPSSPLCAYSAVWWTGQSPVKAIS